MTKFNPYILEDINTKEKHKRRFNFSLGFKFINLFKKEEIKKTKYEELYERWIH